MIAQVGLEENEELPWGDTCPKIEIQEVELELRGTDDKRWWETQLQDEEIIEGRTQIAACPKRVELKEDGMVKAGWAAPHREIHMWGKQQWFGTGKLQGWQGQ